MSYPLPLAIGLLGHDLELGHICEQPVESIGDNLLCRAAVDRAGETQFQVTFRVEAERERGLALGARSRTRARSAPR